jgi:single-stranded DNA-binding protein
VAQRCGLGKTRRNCRRIRMQRLALYIEGKLQTTSWEDRQSGEKKFRTEIVADDLVLLGSRERGNGAQRPRSDHVAEKLKSTNLASAVPAGEDSDIPF